MVHLIFQNFQLNSQLITFPLDLNQTRSGMSLISRCSLQHKTIIEQNKTLSLNFNPYNAKYWASYSLRACAYGKLARL
jgi:hypothetical protein